MRNHYQLCIVAVALLSLIGCSQTAPPTADVGDGDATPPATIPAANVEIKLVSADEFTAEMDAKKGKVVLLDMWATW